MATPRYPKKLADFVPWILARAGAWKLAPASVGLSAGQATAIDDNAKELSQFFEAANKARQESLNATASQNAALRATLTLLQQDLRIIDAFAANSPDPNAVYTAAQVSPPNVPGTLPPPALPTDTTVGINTANGAVILRWKASNPGSGTVYKIERRFTPTGPVQFVGLAGAEKTFADATLPIGTDAVTYFITGQRSGVVGPTAQVNVRFGTVGGTTTATVVGDNAPVKMAA